ncbi:O-acetyl-ADP-ribose deacetylase [Aeoliella mucimassa]|uniref:O-acetyl-ADP-ribose deacetylase n=1 Tax=Aeoliella mucimassa TaxID=2527972 RepID=A0A518ANU0_9BACT|nr:O-acetyl-ADP-ribose deacetylase [Aeoliella mucimassa]QDU56387.1 O-acetyl-ADP-ribose deacetylase [Aeoliella mucimassa]
MQRIRIVKGDITTLKVDAVVNAANERMLGGGGVDGAIHQAAGPKLLAACEQVPTVAPEVRCPTGEARITPGFNLPANWVIHTVGPVWHGGQQGEAGKLAKCYQSCLSLAFEHDIRSVAFPAISCGVYRFPPQQAAEIARRETEKFLAKNDSVDEVLFVAFEPSMVEVMEQVAESSNL